MTYDEIERKAEELVDAMTVEEAASQLLHSSPAIERLGIPEYNWWSEALHGAARAGTATVFPEPIGMAAMFDDEWVERVFDVVSTEARAKYNAAVKHGDRDIYKGLTHWTPNINIFRDPRWGRGQETYGEDPFLTERMGVAVVKGLQGKGKYLKIAACAKHFAAHSGPEAERHRMDVRASEKDLEETYLPAFEAAVKEGHVEAIMGAYTRLNGEPCCASHLLPEKVRGEWGFDGHIVSDCWAVRDFHENHKYTPDGAHSASLAVRMGCDVNCGCTYRRLLEGLRQGLVTEQEIRTSAKRAMRTRIRLGMFSDDCEYDAIPYSAVDTPENRDLARRTAERSAVLLHNDGVLPIDLSKIKTIGVIGPNAYSADALFGNYNGDSSEYVTYLDGIRRAAEAKGVRVMYSKGCDRSREADEALAKPNRFISEALSVAEESDVVVLCLGLNYAIEGEEGDTSNGMPGGDRADLLLPKPQSLLAEKVLATGKPTVLVLSSGSCIDTHMHPANALLQMWYSGERGGEALANIIFGEVSPAGKLPVTFYYDNQPMPDFSNYSMQNRTYRYLRTAPLYPFGYGLSYSDFEVSGLELTADENGLHGSVTVKNVGCVDGDETVQCYVSYLGDAFEKPAASLCFFKRVSVKAGESVKVAIEIAPRRLASVLEDGSRKLLDGDYVLYVGTNGPDARSVELTGKMPLAALVRAEGGALTVADTACNAAPIEYPETFDVTSLRRRPKYDLNIGVGLVLKDKRLRALLDRFFPELAANPQSDMLYDMYFPIGNILTHLPGVPKETVDAFAKELSEIE